jgi:hypothetical protein
MLQAQKRAIHQIYKTREWNQCSVNINTRHVWKKDSEEEVKPPKRLCIHQQNLNISGVSARHILIGERRRLVDENVEKPVDVVVNETVIDQSKRLIGRVYT